MAIAIGYEDANDAARLAGDPIRVRSRCACRANNFRRRARFSKTAPSRERQALTIQPRKCRSDAIIARSLPELSEFSLAKSFFLQVYDV
jgi:hypothetical protein